MLRPVGSRIPSPQTPRPRSEELPWGHHYHTEFLDSGTSALSLAIGLAIEASKVSGTPEVILPAYGCPDLVAAVVYQRAKPVLVDLDGAEPYMALSAVEKAVTANTVAIVAVDFLGLAENLTGIRSLINESKNIRLIEDSAQGFPPASSEHGIADYAVLSFGRGKPINLMGGGALLIRSDHFSEAVPILDRLPETSIVPGPKWRLRRLVFNLLLSKPFYGLLFRLPFLGIGKTEYIPLTTIRRVELPAGLVEAGIRFHRQRSYLEESYSSALAALTFSRWLGPRQMTRYMSGHDKAGSSGRNGNEPPRLLRFPVLAPTRELRDQALHELTAEGIGANAFYGRPLSGISGLESLVDVSEKNYPNACDFSERLFTLPLHEDVTKMDVDRVAAVLERLINNQNSY